jgi:predicted 3-demethylubiquinone-9 3-methyltransferase (glyoxalase superfamily)
MTSQPLTTCLWFDNQAEEAARFYTSIFKDSALGEIHRYTEAGPGEPGSVMLVEFELNGQKFTGLNGGAQDFGFNEAVSFCVTCADQADVDYYWDALTADGGEGVACGWLKDKYGVRWQVVPDVFYTMVRDEDQARKARVTAAMLSMVKFDIAALEKAYAG